MDKFLPLKFNDKLRKKLITPVGAASAIVMAMGLGLGSLTVAQGAGSTNNSGIIHACISAVGNIEMDGGWTKCSPGDKALYWTVKNRPGQTGATGLRGLTGVAGPTGAAGDDGADGAAGARSTAQAINAQTGTTYTLVAADAGKLVTLSNSEVITLTVPQDSAATLAIGTTVDLMQLGEGELFFAAGTGATLLRGGETFSARAQYSRLLLQKISANTWVVYGDLAAS